MSRANVWPIVLLLVACGSIASGQSLDPAPTIRVDLDLVLVPVSVSDAEGRPVMALKAEDFGLWEDRIRQDVTYFSGESVPTSVGIVLDTSDSMNRTTRAAQRAVEAFLNAGNAEDEYFLIEFNDQPELKQDFTGDVNRLHRRVVRTSPDGQTALYDAVYRAISKVQQGRHARKALLIVTDGEDNHSRYSKNSLENYVRESGVQIYSLGISSSFGKSFLRDLADLTGGEAVFADSDDDLEAISRDIARTMSGQFLLGYVSTNQERDGAWRELRVRVEREDDRGPFTVRAKRGYYARSF